MNNSEQGNRLAGLDALRILAVVGVVLAHFFWSKTWVTENLGAHPTVVFGDLTQVAAYGFLGVHLFFIISGTVISKSALGRSASEFVIARFLRLMPALLIAVLISAALLVATGVLGIGKALRSILTNLMLMPSLADTGWLNPVFWTLVIEASFYAIVALVVFVWGASRKVLCRFAWIWLGVTVVLSRVDDETLQTIALSNWAPFFIIGILIATAESRSDKFLASLGMFAAGLLAVESTISTMNPEGRSINVIFVIVFAMALVVALVVWVKPISNLKSNNLAFIGTMTYSLYLFHVVPGRMISEYLLGQRWNTWEAYALSFAATIALSYLVTKFLEPAIRGWFKSALKK